MRRSARILGIHRVTVARKKQFIASQSRIEQSQFLQKFKVTPVTEVQFDDIETFEHTKYKPLSITLAVTPERHILGFKVSRMPAKGHLAEESRQKYGIRRDQRRKALTELLTSLKEVVDDKALFRTDQNPLYPSPLRTVFPNATHETCLGRRGCIVGQGELKKIPWDPLFSLNHTAAMLRANINRLFRRTWCTTKVPERLSEHLDIYVSFHNRVLLAEAS